MASRFILPYADVGNGISPSDGAKLYFFETGTSTKKNTYSDEAATTANTNPVVANGDGVFGEIWLTGAYKVVLKDKNNVQIWEEDPVYEITSVTDTRPTFPNLAAAKAATPTNGQYAYIAGRPAVYKYDSTDASTADDGIYIALDSVSGRWIAQTNGQSVAIEQWGVSDGDNITTALQSAILYLRSNGVSISQYIGGSTITAYTSGTITFGRGSFVLDFDTFLISQEMGLIFKGQGSRGRNQAIKAATTLLFSGTSSGYGFKFFGNGARNAHFEDMDISYLDSNFTGDLIDSLACPGLTMTRVRLGCDGGTAGTRVQTAQSLVRTSFDEFQTFKDCVFDGAVDCWWSDDVRAEGALTFGGWGTTFDNCTFYDCTGNYLKHSGARTRTGVSIINPAFNPINVDCTRAIDFNNVEGFNLESGICTPSTTKKATAEWIKLVLCTGSIHDHILGDLSPAGTLNGNIDFSNNRIFCTDGLDITGGVITGSGNEFSQGTSGWKLVPTGSLVANIGPDQFKAAITNSYYVTPDSANLGGKITYSAELDASSAGFTNASNRVTIRNADERLTTVSSLPSTGSVSQTGRTYNVTAAGTFTLPAPVQGTMLRVHKQTTNALTIAATGGTSFLVGDTGSRTSCIATTAETGAMMEFVALSSTIWIGKTLSGTWSFT